MSKEFFTLEVATTRDPKAPQKERLAAFVEQKRRTEAVMAYLKAKGHTYMKRSNAFATKAEAERAILEMGFPYKIEICKAGWV
tara:strand:- start:131 stop:379 length:249 start_codon:yes stop_codon:yes gene_type:complete